MALIQVAYDLIDNKDLFDRIMSSFDSVEFVRDEPQRKHKVFRVQCEEITKEDKVICPELYQFAGVNPFIIQFDAE